MYFYSEHIDQSGASINYAILLSMFITGRM